jgi:hypothetical protein
MDPKGNLITGASIVEKKPRNTGKYMKVISTPQVCYTVPSGNTSINLVGGLADSIEMWYNYTVNGRTAQFYFYALYPGGYGATTNDELVSKLNILYPFIGEWMWNGTNIILKKTPVGSCVIENSFFFEIFQD